MSAPRYIQLINMGGDHCGMGLATDYPDGHEDAATRSRADDSEWIKASDHDDVVRELVEALEECADDLAEWIAISDSLKRAGFNMDDTGQRLDRARAALAKIAQEG